MRGYVTTNHAHLGFPGPLPSRPLWPACPDPLAAWTMVVEIEYERLVIVIGGSGRASAPAVTVTKEDRRWTS